MTLFDSLESSALKENKIACTQDNLKGLNPSDLATWMRQNVKFALAGGHVKVVGGAGTLGALMWHPYWNVFLRGRLEQFHHATASNENIDQAGNREELLTAYQSRMLWLEEAFKQLHMITPLGKSVRTLSIERISRKPEDFAEKLKTHLFTADPGQLVAGIASIEEAVKIYPYDGDKTNHRPEYFALIERINQPELPQRLAFHVDQLSDYRKKLQNGLDQLMMAKSRWFDGEIKKAYEDYLEMKTGFEIHGSTFYERSEAKKKTDKTESVHVNWLDLTVTFGNRYVGLFGHQAVLKDWGSREKVEDYLAKLTALFDDAVRFRRGYIDNYIKRLNTGMEGTTSLAFLCETIQRHLNEINEEKILTRNIEINSRNFFQIHVELKKTIDLLDELSHFLARYPSLAAWNSFLASQGAITRNVIDLLKQIPVDQWVHLYRKSVEEIAAAGFVHPLVPDDEKEIENVLKTKTLMWQQLALEDLNQITYLHTPENHTSHPSVRQKLSHWFSGKKLETSSQQEQKPLGSFLVELADQENAPIQVVAEDGEGGTNKEIIDSPGNKLYRDLFSIDDKMDNYAITERFGIAKTLAQAILDLNCTVKVLQTRNANILCLLPEAMREAVLNVLDPLGVKEFKGRTSTEDAIIESLLETKRKQIMVLFNGLMNDADLTRIDQQYLLKSRLEQVGFSSLSIWSKDILDSSGLDGLLPLAELAK